MEGPRFTVVTDSTADIAPAIASEYGISIVPLGVSFGAEAFVDGDLTQPEFYERMRAIAPKLPTTSQPPIGAFIAAYERALESAEQVISVHISNRLSGTIECARHAAEEFAGRVHVFDSLNLSWGEGLQVIEAAKAAREGITVDAALARLESARTRVRLIVGLDSLDNLARGGRIGAVSAFLGTMLNLKVTLRVDSEGAFQPLYRDRGESAALAHTLAWVSEQMGTFTRGIFAVGHAMSSERAERLAAEIRAMYPGSPVLVYEAGCTISAHTGTGWGVALLPVE
jgi:DegV family protein with EDD domain